MRRSNATSDRRGRCGEVGHGTLLLDEVDCLPLDSQARLLRVLEERVFEPVGSTQVQQLEARIIAVSNRCLKEEKDAGREVPDRCHQAERFAGRLDYRAVRSRR